MIPQIIPSVVGKSQKEINSLFKKLKGVSPLLHLDLVDGRFSHNHSLDFPFRLNPCFKYMIHLMINDPEKWMARNKRAWELIIPQFEAVKNKDDYIFLMKKNKQKIAFALKPETKISHLKEYLSRINYILILTVHPGFYGKKFLREELKKILLIKRINPHTKIIVDGGMNTKTIRQAAKAGADYFVSGSYLCRSENPLKAMKELRKALK